MKFKMFIPVFLAVVLGFFLGKLLFDGYDEKARAVFQEGETLYFLQFGVYEKLDDLKKNFKDYQNYLVILENDGYHLYGGISRNKKFISELESYYIKENYPTYIKEKQVSHEGFLSILTEYEKILSVASSKDFIPIERIILSNYEELVLET